MKYTGSQLAHFLSERQTRKNIRALLKYLAPGVILTAHDDAMNIYRAVYCRRMNPDLHIVSRITYDRNLEAIHRAGAERCAVLAAGMGPAGAGPRFAGRG